MTGTVAMERSRTRAVHPDPAGHPVTGNPDDDTNGPDLAPGAGRRRVRSSHPDGPDHHAAHHHHRLCIRSGHSGRPSSTTPTPIRRAASGRPWCLTSTTSPDFYIRRSGPTDTAPRVRAGGGTPDHLAYMERMIPRLVAQLTGHPYRGRVLTGCADRDRDGWITIVPTTAVEQGNRRCGSARGVGQRAGRIWLRAAAECYGADDAGFRVTVAHELGHAMGFWHVPMGHGHVMAPTVPLGRTDFTEKERQHAQLAYQRGRHARFCGTAETCAAPSL